MSWLDYKYSHSTIRQRFRVMLGLDAGPIEWVFRLAILALMVRTSLDPTEPIYMGVFGWVCTVFFVFFYLI
jgi:hypothetical protein